MISEKEELLEWRKRAAAQPAGRVVLDLEADSLHRYQEKICLIQYADETGSCLIDPLSIEDMGPFYNWLKETEVWMHGADYDMSLFQNAWETLPAMIWDTQTAARLLGFRQFGLAVLVEHFHGITLSKSSQKADWARRPLSPTMVTYALNDVNYMLDMADKLTAALREKGRMGWFEEICRHSMERARERHLAGHQDPWRIQGCGKLTGRGWPPSGKCGPGVMRKPKRGTNPRSWFAPMLTSSSGAWLSRNSAPWRPRPVFMPTGAAGS